MNATLLYRITSIIYVFFAAGHTFGSLNFKAPTPEGQAVLASMNNVHFQVGGQTFSYGGFYKGFALTISVSMIVNAVIAWQLGTAARKNPSAIRGIAWTFFASQAVMIVLSFLYFAVAPAVFSIVTALLLGWAAWQVQKAGQPAATLDR